jgi:hypothetical protein
LFVDNPQLLFTLDQPPKYNNGRPRPLFGVAMLDKYLCVVYNDYTAVLVFDCEDGFEKIKEIQVNETSCPNDIVGCSLTSQLFVSDWNNVNIWRVNVNTGVSDVFVKLGYKNAKLSLVENRLLVTSPDSLLMYDIHSGERMKNVPLTEGEHAIESNRDSFFVRHRGTVSEIDSEGRVIRVFDNKELYCRHLALDSVGRLLVADWKTYCVVLLDEHLQFIKILLDKERLDNARPSRLSYNKNHNKLAVGLYNGHVKIFDCLV